MLGIIYLILCFLIGYGAVKCFLPGIHHIHRSKFFAGEAVLCPWMVSWPASFLTGAVLCTWITYLAAYGFAGTAAPLFWANVVSLIFFFALISGVVIRQRSAPPQAGVCQQPGPRSKCLFEIIFLAALLVFWGLFLFRTLHIDGDKVVTGASVYGDFGVHLGFIRSFSWGANFPAEHPHFGGVPMHKHFLFQFLAGNLDYLGLPVDWAYNLPSLLSFMAFIMLLYSLGVLITGERAVGALASVMVLCRSSLAFQDFFKKFDSFKEAALNLLSYRTFIGHTKFDNWGIWTPNVHLNQRHFSFSLAVLVLIVIAVMPLAGQMVAAVRSRRSGTREKYGTVVMSELFFRRDAWLPRSLRQPLFLGVLLGLTGFFNAAVVLGAVLILAGMAVFSKQRLTHFIIIVVTAGLMLAGSKIIIGSPGNPVAVLFKPGFLAPKPTLGSLTNYYFNLLSILPLVVVAGLIIAIPGTRRLALAFVLPLVFVNFIQLSIKSHDGHKMAQISFYLLNIFAAFFVVRLFKGKFRLRQAPRPEGSDALPARQNGRARCRWPARIGWGLRITCAIVLFSFLIVSGVIDLIVLYNQQGRTYGYDRVMARWIARHTDSTKLFLSRPYVAHPILLAGRRLFLGRPYYVKFLGYDTDRRAEIVRQIYSARDAETVTRLLHENRIGYVVIDRALLESEDYSVNEDFFKEHFRRIYDQRGTSIYEVSPSQIIGAGHEG